MSCVMSIIICLLFFMVVIMGWKIGAIEVLSLIVFVGFAVDYCLHVGHKYHSCHIADVMELDEDVPAGSPEIQPHDKPVTPADHPDKASSSASTGSRTPRRVSLTIQDA